ncbi:MAG: sulfite exporter TauE/SafE family protein [Thomasclavelia sp.]|nr:sulfite exporter TauE/SafE family protein [Thomasclavelia sp.]
MDIITIIVCIVGGLGAGIGTGLAGLSAATVIAPMLITFLGVPAYQAIGVALASDVLASGVSAYTYGKNKNIDLRHGIIMLVSVLIFTLIGSYLSSLLPNTTMGSFSKWMPILIGIKFIFRPVTTTKEDQANKSEKTKIIQSILCGVLIGFICGFVGAGGGMMLLLVLTSVLGYELKTAVGTSVFIMAFTAFTGAMSHFYIGGIPNLPILILCMLSTLLFARVGAMWANSANVKKLNQVTGVVLLSLGIIMVLF